MKGLFRFFSIFPFMLVSPAAAAHYQITPSTAGTWNSVFASLSAGDTLTLAPGTYTGQSVPSTDLPPQYLPSDGAADRRILVRAAQKGTVTIRARGEWVTVNKKYWTFENLTFDDQLAVHVFHVKAGGAFFIVRNCHFSNLTEAPLKMSSEPNVDHPDHFLFENNESERVTGPYGSENLNGMNVNGCAFGVARGNYFHDISKSDAQPFYDYNGAYGGFFKGGAKYCILENNVADRINGFGVSLGGGTTGQAYFRENTFPHEAAGCIVRNNVVIGYPNRDYGNRGICLRRSKDNLIYNNTVINAMPITIQGEGLVGPPIDYVGVGNIFFNNLTVNMWNADSIWAEEDGVVGGAGLIRDGIQYIWEGKSFVSMWDQQIFVRNMQFNNRRIDVADLSTIFWDPANYDFRLKPEAAAYGLIGTGAFADSAMLKANADTSDFGDFIDSLLAQGIMGPMADKLGNARPNPPSIGAYEAYDSQGNTTTPFVELEDSRLLRADVINARVAPNPCPGIAAVQYTVAEDLEHLEITIWDARGRMVFNLFHGAHPAGEYARVWNGRDHEGRGMPSGTYFLRFRSKLRQFQLKFALVN